MIKRKLLLFLFIVASFSIYAQENDTIAPKSIVISGEIAPRAEYSQGYGNPVYEKNEFGFANKTSVFTHQRSRLNFEYNKDKIQLKAVVQDVRVWGETPLMTAEDGNKTGMHEAWGEFEFIDNFSLRVGRSELIYDDQRILGNENWNHHAASHDLAILKYSGFLNAHLGIAQNFDIESETGLYEVQNSYKNMQYLWLNKSISDLNISLLFMNVGTPEVQYHYDTKSNIIEAVNEKSVFAKTFGTHICYQNEKIFVKLNAYLQSGVEAKDWINSDSLNAANITLEQINLNFERNLSEIENSGNEIKANNIGVEIGYKITKDLILSVGYEKLSGDNILEGGLDDDFVNNSFLPTFGSNHLFNGSMDYFTAQNFNYDNTPITAGLQDISLNINYHYNDINFKLNPHYFMTAGTAEFYNKEHELTQIDDLGIEIDFCLSYEIYHGLAEISLGYSHLLPSDGLLAAKGINLEENIKTTNWAWFQIEISPIIFNK